MKKTIILVALGLSVTALLMIASGCKKDTECKLVVTVKYLSDTNIIVPQCSVMVKKYDIEEYGFTNSAGQFSTTFKYEAILDIFAEKDTSTDPLIISLIKGTGAVRLVPGQTVHKSVFISAQP